MVSLAYPTADHVMPYKLFALLAADLPRRWAAERLQQTQAIAAGIAAAFSGSEPEARLQQDRTLDQAFPQPEGTAPVVPQLFAKPE